MIADVARAGEVCVEFGRHTTRNQKTEARRQKLEEREQAGSSLFAFDIACMQIEYAVRTRFEVSPIEWQLR